MTGVIQLSPPLGWSVTTAADVCEKIQDGTHFSPKEQFAVGTYPYVTAKNVRQAGLDLRDITYLSEPDHREIYARCDCRRGDVLLVKDGVNTGDVAINTVDGEISLLSSVCMLRPKAGVVDAGFLRYYLRSPQCTPYLLGGMTGTAIRRIILKKIKALPVLVCSLQEQRTIVAAIESHFSRLDAATVTLERVQRNLERYRASVLKAAVAGRLVPTEAELAKKEGRSYEPASVLLKRILAERRRRWEETELAKLQAKGKTPTDDRWKSRYEEPPTLDTDGLPELPEGWCWATAEQLASSIRNGCSTAPREKHGVRILRISAVRSLACDVDEVRFLPEPLEAYQEFLVQPGDLLFTRYNGTRSLVGVGALVRHLPAPTVHPDKLIRVQLVPGCDPGFVELATNVGASRRHVESRIRTTAGQAGVSGADIKSLPVPLPPAAEQWRIREASDELLTVALSVSATVLASLARSARARQSILKWAFEGRLVQVADDPSLVGVARRLRR